MTTTVLRKVAEHIVDHFDDTKAVRLADELESAISDLNIANDRVEIMALAENAIERARSVIQQALVDRTSKNSYPPFKVDGSYLVGTSFTRGQADKPVWQFADLVRALANLTETEFEALGWILLPQLGVRDVSQTSQTRDGGVDFFGAIPIVARGLTPVDILVAAEFKSTQVSAPQLRAFEEGVERQVYLHGRFQSPTKIPISLRLFRRTPVVFMLFCGTQLSNAARLEAAEDGVIVFEGAQIANLLEPLLPRSEDVSAGVRRLASKPPRAAWLQS